MISDNPAIHLIPTLRLFKSGMNSNVDFDNKDLQILDQIMVNFLKFIEVEMDLTSTRLKVHIYFWLYFELNSLNKFYIHVPSFEQLYIVQ